MKRKKTCLLALAMVLSAAGSMSGPATGLSEVAAISATETADSNLLSQIENAEVTPENLGIPGEAHYGTKYYARNIWDMVAVDGKVLLSMGDYGTNTGAVPIYYYKNDSTTKYECTYESSISTEGLSSEEIKRFYEIDGEIYATATDPLGRGQQGSYYKYDRALDKWIDYYKLPWCIHCYDMVEYDGEVFFAGMVGKTINKGDRISCVVQKLNKDKLCSDSYASNVYFYDMDGNKMEMEEIVNNGTTYTVTPYWRSYDIFVYKNELYAAHHSSSTNYTKTRKSGLFKYDKANNRFVQVSRGDDIKGFMSVTRNITSYTSVLRNRKLVEAPVYYSFEDNSPIYSPLTIGQEEIYSEPICGAKISTDNTFVAVCNGIFKSSDGMTFEKVSLGNGYENYVTRDAFEKDGKYYFLASEKNGTDDFTTAVFETDNNFTGFRKVLSFDTKSFARSFVYNEGYLYVGLGGNGKIDHVGDSVASKYSGTLYRINLSDWISDNELGNGDEGNTGDTGNTGDEGNTGDKDNKQEYTELECVEIPKTNAESYFSTGMKVKGSYTLEIKMQMTSEKGRGRFFNYAPYSGDKMHLNQDGNVLKGGYSWYYEKIVDVDTTKPVTYRKERNKIYLNGKQIMTGPKMDTLETTNELLFGSGQGKIYYFKIWDEKGNLLKDYIPVKDKEGSVCMYERVAGEYVYYTGSGTVNGIAKDNTGDTGNEGNTGSEGNTGDTGDKDNEQEYTELECVEIPKTNAESYFSTGMKVKGSYTLEIKMQMTSEKGSGRFFNYAPYSGDKMHLNQDGNVLKGGYSWYYEKIVDVDTTKPVTYRKERNKIYLNGKQIMTGPKMDTLETTNELLFGSGQGKIYYFKIWDEKGNLLKDYIPVKDKEGSVCMYERVAGEYVYYTGSGTVNGVEK